MKMKEVENSTMDYLLRYALLLGQSHDAHSFNTPMGADKKFPKIR